MTGPDGCPIKEYYNNGTGKKDTNMKIDDFGAILYAKWKANTDPTSLTGFWAEDDSAYIINVPEQLRDQIILLQNTLSEKYNEMEQTRKLLKEQERALCLLLKDKSHV